MEIADKFTIIKILEKNGLESGQISNIFTMAEVYEEANRRKPEIETYEPEETDLPIEAFGAFAGEFDLDALDEDAELKMALSLFYGGEISEIPDPNDSKPKKVEMTKQVL